MPTTPALTAHATHAATNGTWYNTRINLDRIETAWNERPVSGDHLARQRWFDKHIRTCETCADLDQSTTCEATRAIFAEPETTPAPAPTTNQETTPMLNHKAPNRVVTVYSIERTTSNYYGNPRHIIQTSRGEFRTSGSSLDYQLTDTDRQDIVAADKCELIGTVHNIFDVRILKGATFGGGLRDDVGRNITR